MVPGGVSLSPKRLLKPPNPTPSDPFPKKTRHLPDLSLCHSCHRHFSSPLLPLHSLWRIVLLCPPCLSLLRRSRSCSYCFSAAEAADCHRCSECRCRVHRRCADRYGVSPPWSYCKESVFSVCVDCWVPKSLAGLGGGSDRGSGKRVLGSGDLGKRVLGKRVLESGDLGKRVLGSGGLGSGELPKRVLKSGDLPKRVLKSGDLGKRVCEGLEVGDGVCKKGKGLKMCSEGEGKVRGESKRKRVGAAGRESEKGESERSGDGSGLDDAELAIRLHRAMNSSPRISRKFSLGSTRGLSPPIAKVDNGDSLITGLEPKGKFDFTYKRRGNDNKLSQSIDAASVSVTSSEEGSSKHELLVYRRKCKACDECQVKEDMISENSNMISENQNFHMQELLVYRRKCKACDEGHVKKETISENSNMISENQNFHMQDLLVYRRKAKRCDECEVREEVISDDGMVHDNQICQMQDLLVYKRKSKALDEWNVKDGVISENGLILENQTCHTQDLLVYRRKCKKEDECQENTERVPEHSDLYFENNLSVDSDASQGHLECNGICDMKMESSDRYLLKFKKRNVRSKELTDTRSLILHDGSCAESGKEAIERDQRSAEGS